MLDSEGKSVEPLPPFRTEQIVLHEKQTYSLAYEFKVQGADLEENSRYTFEVQMDYTETELMQVEQDLIEKAMGIDIDTIENNQFRRELDFHAVLI